MSESELITLYVNYSRLDLNENNNEELYIIQILKDIGYHTLTAKLIACYAFDIGLLPSEVVADGVINDLALYDNQDEQISTIIDKYKLEDNELYALRVLALFPNGISKGKFQKLDRVTLRLYPQLVNNPAK